MILLVTLENTTALGGQGQIICEKDQERLVYLTRNVNFFLRTLGRAKRNVMMNYLFLVMKCFVSFTQQNWRLES